MKALTYFEADVDYCSRTYGVAPCTAAIGVTGSRKCTNCRASCQDIANFEDVGATLRFAQNTDYLPREIDCVPNIKSVKFSPGTVSLGEDLGERSSLEVEFIDHRHPDTGVGFDKYAAERIANGASDGNDEFTKILLRFNGTPGASAIVDEAKGRTGPHVWSVVGGATLTNAVPPISGPTCGLFPDGVSYWTTPDHADYTLGAGDWTVDYWMACASQADGTGLRACGQGDAPGSVASRSFVMLRQAGNFVSGTVYQGSTAIPVSGTSTIVGASGWTHVEFCRVGNVLKLFINGVQEGGDVAITGAINDSAEPFSVGQIGAMTTFAFQGVIDNFRLTVGRARHTANFTPTRDTPYDPFKLGSFWPKFRARHPFLQGRNSRLVRGLLGQALAGMDTRHYVIETTNGPTPDGVFKIISKDILKLADGDRAQAPSPSNGKLAADIDADDTLMRLGPVGVGAEYPSTGFINLGGKEIVQYTRQVNATLLLHGDGANGTFVFTDSGPFNKSVVRVGGVTISTAQSVFGGASINFPGTDAHLQINTVSDQDFAFGTAPFNINFRVRFSASPASRTLHDYRFNLADTALHIFSDASSKLTVAVGNTNKIVGTTTLVANQWYHVALTRDGAQVARLYLDGGLQGSVTMTDNLVIGASNRPLWGTRTDGAQDFAGFLDEVYVLKGSAIWSGSSFTVPTQPFGSELGDVCSIVRAQMNTTAETHQTDERAQRVLQFVAASPADIINYLLVNHANVPPSYIPLSAWQTECATYLGNVYTANIAEPTAVAALISELIEQAALAVWWDDAALLIRLQVLRAIPISAARVTDDTMMIDSLEVEEQPDKRISRVLTYIGQLNPLKNLDQLDNYRSSVLTIDASAEADYEGVALKKIFSRWIAFGGNAIAARVNTVQLARYRNAPRRISYKLMRYNEPLPSLGAGYNLRAWCFQDDVGNAVDIPVEIVRLNPTDAVVEVEAEEMRFAGAALDPNDHTITIDFNSYNINLRTLHDSLFGAPVAGNTVTLIVSDGVIIGSQSPTSPALDIGSWPSSPSVPITIKGSGRIQGKGGNGGETTHLGGAILPQAGGTALKTTRAISIDMAGGEIWGGGGGGGNGAFQVTPEIVGVPGSGGQGQTPGLGGGQTSGAAFPGHPGTTEAPGPLNNPGGNTNPGGAGGASGQSGGVGFGVGAQLGGAGGPAIDGNSFVTMVNVPDIDGAQIN